MFPFSDFSRKDYIYFKKTKDEVSSRFQLFKALVESWKSKKIKLLRQIKPSQNQCKREKKWGVDRDISALSMGPTQQFTTLNLCMKDTTLLWEWSSSV